MPVTLTVRMPSRILDRHVGGNTTYARHLSDGLLARGHHVDRVPAGPHPAATALCETLAALQGPRPRTVTHWTSDTGPLLRSRHPAVLTVHGVASRWIDVARTPAQERVWRLRVGRAARACRRVVTVSESSREDVAATFGVAPERITVIHHGIRLPDPGGEVSDAVALALREPFLLYVGNLEPRKNLVALSQAVRDPRVRAAGLRLVVAGRPAWNYGPIVEELRSNPDVVTLGFVTDAEKRALLDACTAFVFPSLYEGFGFPVLEALAAGAATLTSSRGSLAEVAGPAVRIEDLSAAGIADALAGALGDPAGLDACRAAGPAWAARFSWDRAVDRHVAVYTAALEAA